MIPTRPHIVITGAAVITCLGASRKQTWRGVLAGECGIGPLTELETPVADGKDGGQAAALPEDFEPALSREARYLRRTILDALADAGAGESLPYAPERCGILLGTTLHGMREGGKFLRTGDFAHLCEFPANAVLSRAIGDLPIGGMSATTCSACSSSLGAIALAVSLLESGELDLVIAGGYDPISEYAYGGFNSLRLVAQGPLRPFARGREGMKVSEGYGIVILERAGGRSGTHPLAQILGYGESADAHHLTQPHPAGDGAARAIGAALASAGCSPADIDLIAAHATGTPDNDAGEYAAFSRIFGADLGRVPVVAFKSHLGHTLGGAGAIELILSAMALRDQTVPPCSSNVKAGECEFPDLNLSTGSARRQTIRATLNTSLGFGGANTCIILGRPSGSSAPTMPSRKNREVCITGIGILLPGIVGADAFARHLLTNMCPAWTKDAGSVAESDFVHLLNARRMRRMSDYVKLTLAATALAIQDAGISDPTSFAENCCAILGSSHGSSAYCHQYYGEIIKEGLIGANPMLFAEGVPNAAAAHLSLMLSLKGACQTILGSRTAGLDALHLASCRIASGAWDRAIVSAGEEYNPIVNATYRYCGHYAGAEGSAPFDARAAGFVSGAGAATFILESRESIERRGGGRIRGRILSSASARAVSDAELATRTRDLIRALGPANAILCSANGSSIDATELAAIRSASPASLLSTVYGHIAESHSVLPLASIAAGLLAGRLPRVFDASGAAIRAAGLRPADGTEEIGLFTTIATDYTRVISGARIACAG